MQEQGDQKAGGLRAHEDVNDPEYDGEILVKRKTNVIACIAKLPARPPNSSPRLKIGRAHV